MKDFEHYKKLFDNDVGNFNPKDSTIKNVIDFKIKHTNEVVKLCEKISRMQSRSQKDIFLAKIIGLFHDIGRIYQIYEYRTLNDLNSMDHGDFGVNLLKKQNFLEGFSQEDKDIVYSSIKYHNKIISDLPKFDERTEYFVLNIRDADKTDIYRVHAEVEGYLDFGSEKGKDYEKERKMILNGDQIPRKSKMSNLYHILIGLSWVNDINYKETFKIIKQDGHLREILNHLPPNYEDVKDYVLSKLEG